MQYWGQRLKCHHSHAKPSILEEEASDLCGCTDELSSGRGKIWLKSDEQIRPSSSDEAFILLASPSRVLALVCDIFDRPPGSRRLGMTK